MISSSEQRRLKLLLKEQGYNIDAGIPPTAKEMAKNLVSSVSSIVRSGIKTVDNKTHSARYEQCLSCEYISSGRCIKCGCFMKIKSKFATMKCPLGKW